MVKRLLHFLPAAAVLAVSAFAQQADFDPSQIANGVRNYVLQIAAAGAGVLVLTVGLSAAWRYAKRFLKG